MFILLCTDDTPLGPPEDKVAVSEIELLLQNCMKIQQ